ncbi:MAG TPA: hypothetical protein EYP17_02445, partial [Candidatus Latescibacteria bacterium]|nr:hypothetical protein [Candidatus Latescibacterota bacterium]
MKAFWPLLVCVLSGTAWAGEFPQVEVPVVGDGTPGPYSLGGHIVVEGTEEVYRRGERLDEGEYNLDGGELRLGFPLPVGDTLLVRFRTVLLRRSYRLWTPKAPEDAGRVPRRPPPPPSPSQDQVRLCVGGSKSIGVVVGSGQGLSLEQSLHLDISGEVGGAKVTAVLSDQDLPFQPEGTTQKLEEIDRVLVRVSGGGLSATFGDYELKWEEGQFGRYSRRLEGVLGKVRSGSLELSVVAAASKGTFCTNSFQGREGDQGPYQLHAEDGDEAIVVLAGTERVWVDGERMERGANRDYIIDYAAAQVTFTPRRLIASDSRIVVDFSYIRRHYPRTTLAAKGRMRLLEGKVQAFGLWIREAEDGRNPVDFSLTPEALTALRGAGDDPRKAGFPGAEPMQGGAYRAVRDEGGREYYEYVGEGLGTHRVRFWFVGEGKGEYRYLGAGVYRYVGPGEGSYLPGTFLPLPERRELWTVGLRLQPLDGVYAEGEWAASVWDRNVLSPSDDGDNMGTAYRLDLRAGKGPWEVQGVLRRTGKRFSPLDRVYGADRERDWGFPSSMPLGEEREGEVSAAYRPTQHTGVRLRYARLKRGSDISVRRGVEVWTREPGRPEVRLLEERIRGSSGPILRRRATLRYRWYIDPYLSYELESAPFLRYYRWEGGASVRGEGWEGEVGDRKSTR